jgi:DNA-binding CsgD family transcriptional regulator
MGLSDHDLRALMCLVNEGNETTISGAGSAYELLPWTVLTGLSSLLSCDNLTLFWLDSRAGRAGPSQSVPDEPDDVEESDDALFFEHYWDCLACSYPDRSGDMTAVTRASDFYTLPQYRSTGMRSDYGRDMGFEREMLACLAGSPGRTLRIVCWRGRGRDFSEREQTILWLLRPHLYELYRRRDAARNGRVDLTPRQQELLRHVAAGETNRRIARHLGVRESTVRKHLERIFDRLQVQSRTAAVARAFPNIDPLPEWVQPPRSDRPL